MMFGLPLWVFFALPFVAMGGMFCAVSWMKRVQEDGRRQGRRVLAPMWPLGLSALLAMISVLLMFGASGQSDEDRVKLECARHGMASFRAAFGRSRCIDRNGQLRAFEDVR
jgi:hypothetical protein